MNLLFVSIAFPPKNDPECIQAARYLKYLSRDDDWEIDVVTSKSPTLFMPVDSGLEKYDTGYRQKVEIPVYESRLLNFLIRKLGFGGVLFPDSKATFYHQWRKAAKHLLVKPDIIYSRSNPMSSAMMALKLKRHFGVPWVMHMSDPWGLSPLHEFSGADRGKVLAMESMFLGESDCVTFTSSKTQRLYAEYYPQFTQKFVTFPNVYDPDDITQPPLHKQNKLRVVYTGGMTGMRNVRFLSDVIQLAREQHPRLEEDVEFIFAGDLDRSNREFFRESRPPVEYRGVLPYNDARSLRESAHLLLTVDNPTSSEDAVFFPSKLLDYFLSNRKIWAVTPSGSVTHEVIQGTAHAAFEHNDSKAMAEFLSQSIRQFKEGKVSGFYVDHAPTRFSALENAEALSATLKRVISSGRNARVNKEVSL